MRTLSYFQSSQTRDNNSNGAGLYPLLRSAVAAGDVGGVGGFFDSVGDGFGDAFVEHGGNDVFGWIHHRGHRGTQRQARKESSAISMRFLTSVFRSLHHVLLTFGV